MKHLSEPTMRSILIHGSERQAEKLIKQSEFSEKFLVKCIVFSYRCFHRLLTYKYEGEYLLGLLHKNQK